MDKDEILRMAGNPEFISGVHNYCDRWCERCPLSSRCSVYAMEEMESEQREGGEINGEAFWEGLHETFQATIELLDEMAVERGIDLGELTTDNALAERDALREQVEEEDLVELSTGYMQMTMEWFDSADKRFAAKNEELNKQVRLELPDADPEAESERLGNIIEILQRYAMLIPAKIRRAVGGKIRGVAEVIADLPRDCDGAAKVALIAIDRSIAAWSRLRRRLPANGDAILDILLRLGQLREATEKEFPEARSFVRPGFDTGELQNID